MFIKHRDRKATGAHKAEKHRAEKHGAESVGFTGLEGDFEAERRRAAEAAHEPAEPYEGDVDKPTLPGSSAGFTHP